MQVFYSLILSLKNYHLILHFTPWSLDLFIQLPGEHTVLQPFRRIELIVHIDISVLAGTHFHLSQVKGEVSCPRTHHLNNVPRLRGVKHDISLKIRHQAGFETARQAATSAEHCAMSLSPSLKLLPTKCYIVS